ncbi:carbohydrate deacetylase [Desulfoferrobacter suflitae]|uniref:carbohydrate deacetylase n=1 Tax=Desulfoferrobacter suflitae TaxID=2865782 RepID=UPI0021649BC1|nr:ChbG/HpnK family deacetylase [Desulfoferrobacter suflitae]MCK8603940.1 ChbG/HpnK family deacetylase [Desulfoferrobacter suflitae]
MTKASLIINADDFGWGRKLSDTILDCHLHGIVTSTTLMVNMPAAEYAAKKAMEAPELSVGVHLNLTEGPPLSKKELVPDLLDESGNFPGYAKIRQRLWRGEKYFTQVIREIKAQVERCLDLGIVPTHCDSHHGVHKFPVVRRAMVSVMRDKIITRARTTLSYHRIRRDVGILQGAIPWLKRNLKRAPAIASHAWGHYSLKHNGITIPDWKATRSMGVPCGPAPKEQLLACILAVPEGCSEILLHPGAHGSEDKPSEWHLRTWEEDTPLCLDQEVASFIQKSGVELVSFRYL